MDMTGMMIRRRVLCEGGRGEGERDHREKQFHLVNSRKSDRYVVGQIAGVNRGGGSSAAGPMPANGRVGPMKGSASARRIFPGTAAGSPGIAAHATAQLTLVSGFCLSGA